MTETTTADPAAEVKPVAPAKKVVDDEPYDDLEDTQLISPPPAPAPKAEAPKAPEKPQHSQAAIRMARRLGIPDDRIVAASPESLLDALDVISSRVEAKPEASKPPEDDDYELPPDADEWADGIKTAVKSLGKRVVAAEKKNQALVAEREQEKQQSRNDRMIETAEKLFQSRDDVFGKGEMNSSLDPKFAARRQTIFKAALAEHSLNPKANFEKLVEQAISNLYDPPAAAESAKAKTADEEYAEKWKAGGVAKPTKTKPAELPRGRDRAIKFLDENLGALKEKAGVGGDEETTLAD